MTRPTGTVRDPERTGALLVALGAVLISFSAVFVRVAQVGPTTAAFYRVAFGGLALCVLAARARGFAWTGVKPMGWALLAAVCFAANLTLWHRSIHYVGPGLATILSNFQVFFLAAAGIFLFGERPRPRYFVALPLAVAGLFLLVGPEWGKLGPRYHAGVWLGLATAAAYAAFLLTLRRTQQGSDRVHPAAILAVVCLVTAALLAVQCQASGEGFAIPDRASLAALLGYGIVSQALGWVVITRGLASVGASRVGLILLCQPALTFLWDILLFSRPTSAADLAGVVLALSAIYLGNTREPGRRQTPPFPTGPRGQR